eukprot:751426-Hanusia_phi.AAC.1
MPVGRRLSARSHFACCPRPALVPFSSSSSCARGAAVISPRRDLEKTSGGQGGGRTEGRQRRCEE